MDQGEKPSARSKKAPKKRDVAVIVSIVLTLIMAALAIVSLLHVTKRVLPVQKFSVVGISVYETAEIINASGVKRGDLLYSLDEEKIEARILERCPYLSSVRVKAVYPTELRIEVEGRYARWYIDVSDTLYALDGDLVVLDEVSTTDGLTKLVLPNVKKVLCGSVPEFSESETELKKTLEVISAIRESSIQSRLTEVNLESRWDIRLVVDGSYHVVMGDMSDLEAKLMAVEEILTNNLPENCVGGKLDVSIPQNPAFQPIYSSSGSGGGEE